MATATKTWTWGTTADGWVFTGTLYWSGGYDGTLDCLSGVYAAKNKVESGYWNMSPLQSWETMFGIASGSTVTHVRIYGIDTRCTAFASVDILWFGASSSGNDALYTNCLASGTQLWAGRRPTGVEAVWTSTAAGTNAAVAAGYQASTSTPDFRLYCYCDTANVNGAGATIKWDNLSIEITYDPPVPSWVTVNVMG